MIARVVAIVALLGACGDDRVEPPVTIEAHDLVVTVTPVPARIEIRRLDGALVFDGGAPSFRVARADLETQTGAFKFDPDEGGPWEDVATFQHVRVDGLDRIAFTLGGPDGDAIGAGYVELGVQVGEHAEAAVHLVMETDPARGYTRASIRTASPSDEHLLGLGGQAFDVDHRGQTVPLWVEEDGIAKRDDDLYEGVWFLSGRRHSTHTPMPIAVSSRGHAIVLDTDARAIFALASEGADELRLEAWEDRIDLRLFVGADDGVSPPIRRALDALTSWVGRPERPPTSIFAPWMDALYGSDEVRRVAQKLRAEDVAVSAIWTEDWRGGNDEGTGYVLEEDWTVDRELYPDFEDVADDLHGDGFLWLTYNNTFLDESADVFQEAIDAGYTTHTADGAPYTFTGVKFRDAALLDLSNPDAVAWAKDVFDDGLALGADGWMADFGEWLQHDSVLASGEDPMQAHNRYPVEWAKLNHALRPQLQIYFMRAAWLGSQPYTQVMWAGDQQTDWTVGDGLPSVIPIGLGLGLTGFPYYGHDIGGYMSQLTVPTTKELWFRWCTLGALTPVMRTHHGRSARANWNWESDAETTAHLARWSQLHMRLVPYLVDMSERFQRGGLPIMRPVALDFPQAEWGWSSTDHYLLGDRILVAPVLEEGATTREVQLPALSQDARWWPLLGGDAVEGGQTITVDAPVTEIPAFVPGGAVLLLYPEGVDTVVSAPASPGTVTAGDVGGDRVVVLFPGGHDARDTFHAAQSDDVVISWLGAEVDGAPASADVDGTTVPLTVVDGEVALTLVLSPDGNLVEFEGGGTVTITGGAGETYELRLRVP